MALEGSVHGDGVGQGGVRPSQQDIEEVRERPSGLPPSAELTRLDRARTVLKVRSLQSDSYGLVAELVRLPGSLIGSSDSFFQRLLADKEALAAELAERRSRRAHATAEQAEAKKLRLQAVQADLQAKKAELERWHEVSRRPRGMSG